MCYREKLNFCSAIVSKKPSMHDIFSSHYVLVLMLLTFTVEIKTLFCAVKKGEKSYFRVNLTLPKRITVFGSTTCIAWYPLGIAVHVKLIRVK